MSMKESIIVTDGFDARSICLLEVDKVRKVRGIHAEF